MRNILLTLIAFLPVLTFSQGIVFEQGSWNELIQKAKLENKPIFVDVYTTWCGPCKQMAKFIFPNEKVGVFYNENFICYQIDAEKGEGIQIAKTYNVSSYPNFIFVKPDGSLFYRTIGSMPAEDFINQGKAAMEELKSVKSLSQWDEEYKSHAKDSDFIYNYMIKRAKTNLNNTELLGEYIQLIPDKFNEKVLSLYTQEQYNLSVNSFAFQNLIENMEKYHNLMGDKLYSYIYYSVTGTIRLAAKTKDSGLLQKCISAFEKIPENVRMRDTDDLYLEYYKRSKDIDKYIIVSERICSKIITTNDSKKAKQNAQALNSFAWTVFENTEDKVLLEKAIRWSEKAIELENSNPAFIDTKANLQYKMGKIQDAIATETIALKLIANEEDAKPYKETLMKMRAGEKTW